MNNLVLAAALSIFALSTDAAITKINNSLASNFKVENLLFSESASDAQGKSLLYMVR
ncbi:hypothetical protein [Psychrobacter sp. ANT_WB68]|uniref:hypothetical protein n=1 Tax=Psychrobacter sp. ANT_WB68 TaxID=2597355 RepID=UPI00165D44F6|nr:hypothetical protein [Psychrobacter sp. ANT_WB68]